jgi:hypothetical protein
MLFTIGGSYVDEYITFSLPLGCVEGSEKKDKNVKSFCLTKCHAIKTYPVLNTHQTLKAYVGSGGIAPHICNFGTR